MLYLGAEDKAKAMGIQAFAVKSIVTGGIAETVREMLDSGGTVDEGGLSHLRISPCSYL